MISYGKETKRMGKRRVVLASASLLIILAMILPLQASAGTQYYYPAWYVTTGYSTNSNPGGYAQINLWNPPWGRPADGHFGEDTGIHYHTVGQSGVYSSLTTYNDVYTNSFAPPAGTKSYTVNLLWQVWVTEATKCWGGIYGCSGYAKCDIDVLMGVQDAGTGAWVGSIITFHMLNIQTDGNHNHWHSTSLQFGTTAASWTLTAGHTYYVFGEVKTIASLYTGSYPTMNLETFAECKVYSPNWFDDSKLPSVLLAWT